MPATLGKYNIMRTLGKGASCKVKLAQDPSTGRKVAIKVMNDNMDANLKQLVMTEIKAMGQLKHDNVIEQLEYGTAEYKKDNGKSKEVSYIVLELALGGELFDFVANSGRFEEPLARYFFKQFLDGLDYCHQNGVAHRDLKPENLLLNHQFNLKIADFGFAAPVEGKDGSGNLTTKLGTLNYMAPEIHLKQPYQGRSVDLFAAAIILFIMVAAHPPFTTAEPSDPFYRCIAASRADIFWRTHCKSKDTGDKFFSKDFKDLVQAMLQLDPAHRPSIPEVLAHPWMQGPTPTYDQVLAEFTGRDQKVKDAMEQERQQKIAEKKKILAEKRANGKANRSGPAGELGEDIDLSTFVPKKTLEVYEKVFTQTTEFYSSYDPDTIEEMILDQLRKENVEPRKVNSDKYKMKFNITQKDQTGNSHEIDMQVRLLNVDNKCVCIEFTRLEGDKQRFNEQFLEYKNNHLVHLNDSIV